MGSSQIILYCFFGALCTEQHLTHHMLECDKPYPEHWAYNLTVVEQDKCWSAKKKPRNNYCLGLRREVMLGGWFTKHRGMRFPLPFTYIQTCWWRHYIYFYTCIPPASFSCYNFPFWAPMSCNLVVKFTTFSPLSLYDHKSGRGKVSRS